MRKSFLALTTAILLAAQVLLAASVYDYELNSISYEKVRLRDFQGKVLMIVNVASVCGYTPQYVTFPMMSKVSVTGNNPIPLYQYLTDKSANPKTGGDIQWNFTKFLIGRDGTILARFEPRVTPDDPALVNAVEKALK
jgi:glutathione peroxidase